jgi:PGM1 C-terminal domain
MTVAGSVSSASMDAFDELQAGLGRALAANRPGEDIDHALVVLPSYSVSESLLSHYGDRIPVLEHRYLGAILVTNRLPACEIIYVSTRRPEPAVVDYYLGLLPPDVRDSARDRIRIVEVDDGTPRSVAARLLDHLEALGEVRTLVGDRPALIEPWNVTRHEVDLALALGVPINGTRPELRPLAFKSEGRRLLRRAGVTIPIGREDVRTTDDVLAAIEAILVERPTAPGVVIKHDDSGAGDGNIVVDLAPMATQADPSGWLRQQIDDLPDWYRRDLEGGGIVEERIAGVDFTSPSAQVDILPSGEVRVLATHEQVLGGPSDQVYLGCRFPADPAYAPRLAADAAAIGVLLAQQGAMGRFSVDFVAARDGRDDWRIYALEVNLRKGGTTHPYSALRNLVPGRYDPARGQWVADDGSTRAYSATDNLVDPACKGLPPASVIAAVADAGLQFDHRSGTGVVLHMLSGLAIDGRLGLTAIGLTPEEATRLHSSTEAVINALGAQGLGRGPS